MTNYVEGKVIAITGAGSQKGFGKLTAEMVAKMGAKVVVLDIDQEGLDQTIKGIAAGGGEIVGMRGDAGNSQDVKALVDLAVKTYGRLDVFVANAGTMPHAPFSAAEKALPAWEKCIDINLKGPLYAISHSYPQFQKQGRGQMVFLSSLMAYGAFQGSSVYSATKVGVRYLANSFRQEAIGKVKVSVIYPTGVSGTNLNSTIVQQEGGGGAFGINRPELLNRAKMMMEGTVPAEARDRDDIRLWDVEPSDIAHNIVYCINQPWGVSIGEIVVRSSNDLLIC
jgi:NADP-dependent 3-hydroxy acid dehydrogenase YdfG